MTSGLPALAMFLAPLPLAAEETVRPSYKTGLPVDLWQWTLAMALVIAGIVLLAWLLRRIGSFSPLPMGQFRVLAALPLTTRERVVLLQAGEKQLVVGVAPGRVQTLCVLEGQDRIQSEIGNAGPGASFAEKLGDIMGRKSS